MGFADYFLFRGEMWVPPSPRSPPPRPRGRSRDPLRFRFITKGLKVMDLTLLKFKDIIYSHFSSCGFLSPTSASPPGFGKPLSIATFWPLALPCHPAPKPPHIPSSYGCSRRTSVPSPLYLRAPHFSPQPPQRLRVPPPPSRSPSTSPPPPLPFPTTLTALFLHGTGA